MCIPAPTHLGRAGSENERTRKTVTNETTRKKVTNETTRKKVTKSRDGTKVMERGARAPTLSPPVSLSHRTLGRAGSENETTVHSTLLLYQFTFHPANRSQT